jgi:DNA primase
MPYIDFQEVKAKVRIDDAAQKLGLALKESKNQFRGACPSCNSGGDRALVITPERGLFFCFSAKVGGDCLALVQHITGIDVQEAAQFLLPQDEPHSAPSPAKKAPQKAASKPPTPFDPAAFAEKLEYSSEVEALGISEDDAKALGLGHYRGKTYIAMRYDTGDIAGFAAVEGAKLPSKLLPQVHNVVAFPKRA